MIIPDEQLGGMKTRHAEIESFSECPEKKGPNEDVRMEDAFPKIPHMRVFFRTDPFIRVSLVREPRL